MIIKKRYERKKIMKVLFLNGSPHKEGVGKRAIREMQKIFEAENIECETVEIGGLDVRGCSACLACYKLGKCAIDDEVNAVAEKLREADALVISSPIYYAAPNGTMISFLNRLFYSSRFDKTMKVGAAITTARRGGITAGLDVVNKYFSICGMPIASGQYWNGLHGALPEDAEEDLEGLQMLRTLASNMVFLMRSIALGKEKYGIPEREKQIRTNFIKRPKKQ